MKLYLKVIEHDGKRCAILNIIFVDNKKPILATIVPLKQANEDNSNNDERIMIRLSEKEFESLPLVEFREFQ